MLKREAPAIAALIFLLCFTSFAIVLALGGGPGAATLEVAIYEAVRFDVDFARAGLLALLQVAICLVLALPILWLARRPGESAAHRRDRCRGPTPTRAGDHGCSTHASLVAGALLVLPPLAAVALSGIAALGSLLRADVAQAIATSFVIAVPAALPRRCALALGLAASARALRAAGPARAAAAAMSLPGGLILAVPPVAVSAGLVRRAAPDRRSVRARHPSDHSRQRFDGASLRAAAGRAAADPLRRALRPAGRQPRHFRLLADQARRLAAAAAAARRGASRSRWRCRSAISASPPSSARATS